MLNSIGRVTSRGVETELATVIGDFTLNGGGAYDRAVMERFPNATCYALQTVAQGCVGGQQDLSGEPLFNAPKWNLSFNGQYDVPVTFHDWRPFVSGSVHWQSQVVFNLLQDPDSMQPAYSLFDLELKGVRMEFATYSEAPVQKGRTTTFGHGAVRKFEASGFEHCGTTAVQDDVAYHTPTGPLNTKVLCESSARTVQGPLKLSWTLSYQ